MTKRPKQSKKGTKHSKRTKDAVQPEEEPDTATTFLPAETPESIPVSLQTGAAEVPVESQPAPLVDVSVAQAAGTEAASTTTRSDEAKANIKEGSRLHQIAGRPTKAQLTLVFGEKGYLLTWPKRTEKFGVTPETFQAALAKGVPAIRLGPGAQTVVEKAKETA